MKEFHYKEARNLPQLSPYLEWIPAWIEDSLTDCFSFVAIELSPGELISTEGTAMFLVTGLGQVAELTTEQERELTQGSQKSSATAKIPVLPVKEKQSFGFQKEGAHTHMLSHTFLAAQNCLLMRFDANVFDGTCFGMGCGSMHFRMQELLVKHNILLR